MTLTTPILVADENSTDRFLLVDAIKKVRPQAQVREVQDIAEVKDLIIPTLPVLPKLVILDVYTARKDGLDTLKEIMPAAKMLKVPVVVFTGLRTDAVVISCYSMGVGSVIAKPLDLDGYFRVAKKLCMDWLYPDDPISSA